MQGQGEAHTPDPWVECPASEEMVRWIARVIEKMGGVVLLGPQRENLCRRTRPEEYESFGGKSWIVESQGLPNLLHELVHALYLGRLEDDHGFDYNLIPLDLARVEHRRHLWEEIAACVISCAYAAPLTPNPEAFGRAWFCEQVEIQGVFHGIDDDLERFRAHLDAQFADQGRLRECADTVRAGYELVERALLAVGAPASVARLTRRAMASELWSEYRSSWVKKQFARE